jgi:hypothetical protein
MTESLAGGTAAAPLSMRAAATLTTAVVRAARQLWTDLERGRRIDGAVLRGAIDAAFGASDATGAWNWKIAYETCEVATVLVLRKFGSPIRARAGLSPAMLPMLAKIAAFAALLKGRTVLDLAQGLQLRRVQVMGAYGIELSGFDDAMRDQLRAYGLFAEIISKLRMLVPSDVRGVEVLSRVLDHYAIERIADREAA